MNSKIYLLALVLLGCLSESTPLLAASQEEKYFSTRDNFIRQFENPSNPVNEVPALAELEKQIKAIVGPVNVEGFAKEGKLNLITLQKDLGFGQVDGLKFSSKQESLFVTTDRMLMKYLAERPKLPKDIAELSKNEEFYVRAFTANAAVTYYAEVPVKSTNGKSYVHAFLGVTAQDIGPFIPKEIFVFVSNRSRIFAVYSPAATEITEIPQCRSEWAKFDKKGSESYEAYRASGLNNKKLFDDSIRYREQGFEAYHRCYDREAKNQKFFTSLKKQAQSIVDRLLKN
jgi:hypothetical protein